MLLRCCEWGKSKGCSNSVSWSWKLDNDIHICPWHYKKKKVSMSLELAICIKFTRWNKSDTLAEIHWWFVKRCERNYIASYSAEILPGYLNTYSNWQQQSWDSEIWQAKQTILAKSKTTAEIMAEHKQPLEINPLLWH